MKKVGYWIAGVLLLIVVIGFFARGYIGVIAMTLFMQPDHAFGDEPIKGLPWRNSADVTPSSEDDCSSSGRIFVHPTTYVHGISLGSVWNRFVTLFNGCCKRFFIQVSIFFRYFLDASSWQVIAKVRSILIAC